MLCVSDACLRMNGRLSRCGIALNNRNIQAVWPWAVSKNSISLPSGSMIQANRPCLYSSRSGLISTLYDFEAIKQRNEIVDDVVDHEWRRTRFEVSGGGRKHGLGGTALMVGIVIEPPVRCDLPAWEESESEILLIRSA